MDISQLMGMMGRGRGVANARAPQKTKDTSEAVHVSALALLKMLVHGRAGIPLEVMGIMVGQFIDEYTCRVVDVFVVPQTATGQSVEAVDEEYQVEMMDRLKLIGRPENLVGWYHSHPGFGCFLSGMDVEQARSYEQQLERSVSLVIDPIQSVRGNVVMDAFRCIPKEVVIAGGEPRQTTSNTGFLTKMSAQALMNGLNRLYYNMPIVTRKMPHETATLLNVHKRGWQENLQLATPEELRKQTLESIERLGKLAKQAVAFVKSGTDDDAVANVGKLNPVQHLIMESETALSTSVDQVLAQMLLCVVF
jgi:26S proteasome regulatory subunit N11